MKTYIERLEEQVENLFTLVDVLCDNSTITYRNLNDGNSGVVYIGGFDCYHWTKKDIPTQLKLKEVYTRFYENFNLLLEKANKDIKKEIDEVNKFVIHTIEQTRAIGDCKSTKIIFRKKFQTFQVYLNELKKSEDSQVFLVPDTNALIQFPEPTSYIKLAGSNKFTFVYVPTVLSELDKLKTSHRDEVFRTKVKSTIKRLKGLRAQGNLLEGVVVNKTIRVKMIATEPNFSTTLTWLDSENFDDRIIASALEILKQHHNCYVALVTDDINLQNKAQMANLTYLDTDDL